MVLERVFRRLSPGAMLLLCLSCGPGSVAFRQGRKAEMRKDYDTALTDFEKALQSEPENSRYLIHDKLARTRASLFHLKQGRRFLAENRTAEATGEFQKAVAIDPTNQAAAQELEKLLAAQAAAKAAREKAIQQSLKAREEAVEPVGVQLKPFPATPLAHFRISADSRKVFETLAKLADLNVAFLQSFQPRPLSLDLTNVKLEDAFQLATLSAGVFWKVITPNSILIVPDTPTNRRDYEEEVLKTYFLSNPVAQASDRAAITAALKQVLGVRNIIDNPESNAIVIRDTPDKVAAAAELIRSLDRAKAEVLVDVTILEANRDRMRELGVIPATNLALAPIPTTITSSTGVTTTVAGALTLNKLGHFDQAYSVILPSAIAQAVLNDTQTHILQNPQVRATDGMKATLKIGSRVPYATGSFLPSFGAGVTGTTGQVGILASTQFQYQDVGVNLDITPHLSANGDVSLHASIEISSVGASVALGGGLNEPTFNQRKVEHDIRLKEGEVSLLGGLIQAQENRTATGLPFLSDIPLLRYLFSSQTREVIDNEVLIMLTPHVIRLPEALANAKLISAGKGTGGAVPGALAEPGVLRPPGEPQ